MIILKINGRLGNQLFIYAYGQALSKRLSQKVAYDFYGFKGCGPIHSLKTFVRFALKRPRYSTDLLRNLPVFYERCHPIKHFLVLLRAQAIKEDPTAKCTCNMTCPHNAYVDGYWQSEQFFQGFEDDLRSAIVFDRKHTPAVLELISEIENSVSVCIHVRRGDYVENPAVAKLYDICDTDYYVRAIIELEKSTGNNNHYYFFSDNIEWCKKNLSELSPNSTFVDVTERYENLDFELMLHCKHFIIANSTYSWWAAWLGKYPRKTVICPKRWANYENRNNSPQCAGWIKV